LANDSETILHKDLLIEQKMREKLNTLKILEYTSNMLFGSYRISKKVI